MKSCWIILYITVLWTTSAVAAPVGPVIGGRPGLPVMLIGGTGYRYANGANFNIVSTGGTGHREANNANFNVTSTGGTGYRYANGANFNLMNRGGYHNRENNYNRGAVRPNYMSHPIVPPNRLPRTK